jgi:hypothetical protein
MPDTIAPSATGSAVPAGVAARALGVIFSPRATYAEVASRPRIFGVLLLVVATCCLAAGLFLSTEVGRAASLDQQLTMMDSLGIGITDEQMEMLEARARYAPYFAVAGQLVVLPLAGAVVAGLAFAVFSMLAGGSAMFRQVFAIVVHSGVLVALQTLFVLPLNYARESLSSTTSLAVFLPMADEAGFIARFLAAIDLFRVWWIVSLAIGLGVLYGKRTVPIAGAMLAIYAAIGLVVAGVMTAFSGA